MRSAHANRKRLRELIRRAFVEIHSFAWLGKAVQAADLVDAFLNPPKDTWSEDRGLEFFFPVTVV